MTAAVPRAFTLIELLVVITIIVILLALLTPAMDQAIYQAELAVCGANMHGMTAAVVGYAFDHQRRWPHRPGLHDESLNWHPMWIRSAFDFDNDDRPALRGYLNINKFFNDPLSPGEVNFDDTLDSVDTHMYASYAIWWDWQYFPGVFGLAGPGIAGQSRMSKMGDRWSWTDGGTPRRFNILVNDFDRIHQGELTMNSHPDKAGVLGPFVSQDNARAGVGTVGGVKQTLSFWFSPTTPERGLMDMNTGFDDGSVRRTSDIEWNEHMDREAIVQVPDTTNADAYNAFYAQVPKP